MSDQLNTDGLKKLYRSNKAARAFFDHCAQRTRNQTETKVHRILAILRDEGQEFSRGEIIEVFRSLAELGCGEFVTGRKGWPSRFVWSAGLVSVARVAAGETATIEQLPDEEAADETADTSLKHSFHLRPDKQISFELPADLTVNEAERLAGFIKTLPIETE